MADIVNQERENTLLSGIKEILNDARKRTYATANHEMVLAYWNIGKLIVQIQGGAERASYGDGLLKRISRKLTSEFGKGFTYANLKNMRQFYECFPNRYALRSQLSWTHYRQLMRVDDPRAREYYAEEAEKGRWSTRELERQIYTQYYERLLSSHREESEIKDLINKNTPSKPDTFDPLKLIHDPFMLEFLGAKEDEVWQERDLENALISHLQEFLLELGRGFAFVGRQKRITIDGQHFYPDLVFYNILTKSYVIIDLKSGKADYSDVGQMQLYVNYYNMDICQPDDNPTVGIILCAKKNDAVIKYTLGDRKDIGVFQAKYDLVMPTEDELRREIEITREKFRLTHNKRDLID